MARRDGPDLERHRDLARLEAFSDGVFAFAATLLALGIRIPRPDDPDAALGLQQLLLAQWPSYLAYALSFTTVGIIWANHHVQFSYFVRPDRALVFLNILGLLFVAFLPVPTAVLGNWLGSERDRLVAVVLYAGTLVVFGLIHNLTWWYGAYRARLTTAHLTTRERRALTIGWSGGPIFYAICLLVAFVNPWLSVAGFVLIHVIYLLPTARLVAAAQRRGR